MDDSDAARDAIAGAWKLCEYHDRETESDSWTPTFRQKPTGILVYLPTGLLSVQVAAAADDRLRLHSSRDRLSVLWHPESPERTILSRVRHLTALSRV
jgi:hypothetical protein